MAKEYKRILVEKKGVTVEKEPETLKSEIKNDSVFTPETHRQSEEIRYVLVESSPLLRMKKKSPEVKITESSVVIEIPGKKPVDSVSDELVPQLVEALRAVHVVLSGGPLNEEESVEIPSDAEADVKVEGDKLVVEIPVESPKEEVTEEEAEVIEEAVSRISSILAAKEVK